MDHSLIKYVSVPPFSGPPFQGYPPYFILHDPNIAQIEALISLKMDQFSDFSDFGDNFDPFASPPPPSPPPLPPPLPLSLPTLLPPPLATYPSKEALFEAIQSWAKG